MNRKWRHHRPLFATPVPASVRKPRIRWRILPIIWLGLKRTCTLIGAMVLVSAFFGAMTTLSLLDQKAAPLPADMVLYLDFADGLNELPAEASFADPFAPDLPTLAQMIDALDRARDDERVKGLFARIDSSGLQLAHVQEIRAAIKRFRESGKFAYIYASSYGEGGNGLGAYYLASAFDEIWMQTMGVVSINGIALEMPYFRDTLDKIGIDPEFYHRKEYKSVYESATNSEMSASTRESMEQLIDDLRTEVLREVPPERNMSPLRFRTLVDKGLFTAREAVNEGLVTKASYADLLVAKILENVTGDPESDEEIFVPLTSYIGEFKRKNPQAGHIPLTPSKPEIALVYVVGTIMPSRDGGSAPGMMGGGIAAADEIAPAILDAGDSEAVQAIVVRIDSPGGSPVASESILRAIEKAQRQGKPIIISMGPTAASGGYWIATYADTIFAMPTTLTGSIGVAGGKIAVQELSEKIGVKWERVQWGENAGMWSLSRPFTPGEAERIDAMLDHVYDGFVGRVMFGREMSRAEAEAVAKGRVWTGARAAQIGLVDEIGGLSDALDYTAKLLGQETRTDLNIVLMPKPKTPFEQFLELLGGGGGFIHAMARQEALMRMIEPVAQEMGFLRAAAPVTAYEPLRLK